MSNNFHQLICEKCFKPYVGIPRTGRDVKNYCVKCRRSESIDEKWRKYISGKSLEQRIKNLELFMIDYLEKEKQKGKQIKDAIIF